MARLGGEFAILMLVAMPAAQFADLEDDLGRLAARGYKVTTTPVEQTYAEAYPGWLFRLEVQGADHEGIIHEVARYLSDQGINIEGVDSGALLHHQRRAPLRHDGPGRRAAKLARNGMGSRPRRHRRADEPGYQGVCNSRCLALFSGPASACRMVADTQGCEVEESMK